MTEGSAVTGRAAAPPLWLLVLITASGTLGMHIFIPALAEAGRDLGADAATMQLTVTLYMAGLAIGQLVYGPLSDRFGRRPVLLAGLLLYLAASGLAVMAPTAGLLILSRLAQALGGCAGLVLGRAIVRDTAASRDIAARLALLNLVLMASPGLAPLAGDLLTVAVGWRAIFVLLCAIAAVTVGLVLLRLPETAAAARAQGLAALAHGYGRLLARPRFLGYLVGGSCNTTSMYAFLSASPYIFVRELGRPLEEVGIYYFVVIMGVSVGSLIANRSVARVAPDRLLRAASMTATVAALLFLGIVLTGRLSVAGVLMPMLLFTTAAGVASPLALTGAVSTDAKTIGSAAGLYGCGQMVIGALCTALAGIGPDPARATALVLAGAALAGQAALAVALRTPNSPDIRDRG